MKYKAFFFVKTPLQYLGAVEAKTHYGYAPQDSLLVLYFDKKNQNQLSHLLNLKDWAGVISLPASSLRPQFLSEKSLSARHPLFRNNLFHIKKLTNIAQKYGPFERIFIGDALNPLMQHLVNKAKYDELVLLDDGIASKAYAVMRKNGWRGEAVRKNKSRNLKAKEILLGLKCGLPAKLTFYSAYELSVASHDIYIKHSYPVLKENFKFEEPDNSVYFLGGSLVEGGRLAEEEYFGQLSLVNDYYVGHDVKYIAHRREDPDRVRRIGQKFGWETRLFDYPIEYQLAVVGPRPKQLASFVSSALENCASIFGENLLVVAFRFNETFFAKKETDLGKYMESVIDEYEKNATDHFKVINL